MSTIRRLVSWLTIASLVAIVAVSVSSHLAPAVGWQLVAIRGGSMEPAIALGSVIVVGPVPIDEVRAGDVVTYRSSQAVLVTHRVVEAEGAGATRRLVVKGDANESADPTPVSAAQLVGRVAIALPVGGYVLAALGTPGGLLAALGWMAALVLLGMALEEDRPRPAALPEPGAEGAT